MWWTVNSGGRYTGVSLCNHFSFSVAMKFVKMKGWGKKERTGECGGLKARESRQAVKGHFSAAEPRVFVTEGPGQGKAPRTVRFCETLLHLGVFESSVLSLCSLLKYWNLLCCVRPFLLWPEASVLESLKRKLLVHWQTELGGNNELQIEGSAVW